MPHFFGLPLFPGTKHASGSGICGQDDEGALQALSLFQQWAKALTFLVLRACVRARRFALLTNMATWRGASIYEGNQIPLFLTPLQPHKTFSSHTMPTKTWEAFCDYPLPLLCERPLWRVPKKKGRGSFSAASSLVGSEG